MKRGTKKRAKINYGKVVKLTALFAAVVFVLAIAVIMIMAKDLPSVDELTSQRMSQSTKIYDRGGQVLLYEVSSGEKRTVVPFDQIPKSLKDATISIEDENFYNEPAFDWRGIARAIFVNITRGGVVQGGSTITQQLARNAFLTIDRTYSRKIKELFLAIKLNERYSKDDILGLYLNQIPYGPTIYGVESASEAYFGKTVGELNLAESATLAAMPKAPSYYSPWGNHTKELMNRQKLVLKKMYELGKITEKQLKEAVARKVNFQPKSVGGIKAPHFVMAVQDYLIQKYGDDMVSRGGLKVITSLDWVLQEAAEKAVEDGVKRNEELYQSKNAALVAQDTSTGQILAMVGSRNYFDEENDGNFNVVTQGLRQPGSALKPFAYLTLFEKGYSPDTVLFDVPTEFVPNNPSCPATVDFNNTNTECFHPRDFSDFSGPTNLRNALAQSINVPAVKTLYLAGMSNVLDTLHDFGITTLNDPGRYGLSLVLGGGEVKLIDLVGAYSVLADEGTKHRQSMILEVRDGYGNTLETYSDKKEIVADAQYSRLINDILSDIDARAGLFRASLPLTVFQDYDVALKTGTTDDYRDAWALGYTPTLAVGVWAGNNDNTPMQRHGGSILAAVPIWHDFMAEALKTQTKQTFNRPEAVLESKPVLNGDYLFEQQAHSILFYVDKSDPLGAIPETPFKDPQFNNWEASVADWAKNNLKDSADYGRLSRAAGGQTDFSSPTVKIVSPQTGEFVGSLINISADINSGSEIKKIEVYLNGNIVGSFPGSFGSNYRFNWSFFPASLESQNSLIIEVVNDNGLASKSETIIYK
ncbi:MAG: penicillin-binding protein [bacterium]|nr:penicillin-binding protein [bacterium]